MKLSLPRGMRDFEPENYSLLEKIRSVFLDVCKLYDFKIMEPSPIELISTLKMKSGPAILNEIYHFKDKSGREVGLRFDLTVGLTRYVVSHRELSLPIKLGSFGGMWRYDEPQYGRYRWFHQWNVEIFGSKNIEADAEVIDFASTMMNKLGIYSASIEIGDRRVVEEFIKLHLKIDDKSKILEMLRALDKLGRKSVDEVLNEYSSNEAEKGNLKELIQFGKIKGRAEEVLNRLRELGLKSQVNLEQLIDSLNSRGVQNVLLNMSIVRGLDYYTGIVFEIFDRENIELGALAGGGRYDILPEVFGRPDIGATGVAGGVERISLALKKMGKISKLDNVRVYVAYAKPDLITYASKLTSMLRRNDIPTDMDISGRSLKRQMEVASSKSVKYVVLIAPREYSEGKVILRDMDSREERVIKVDELIPYVK